jgi:hypothetical protein
VLGAHAAEMPARVDEDGLELGGLATLHGAAELLLDVLACFRVQQLGEMVAEQLGVRVPGGSLRRGVHMHEPAIHVVQARRHHEAVDQRQVDVLQTVGHGATCWTNHWTCVNQRAARVAPGRPGASSRADGSDLTVTYACH